GIRDFHVTGVQTCALPIYHFATLDDLLIATLIACARDMATEVYWMIDRARSREGLRRSSGSPDSGPSAADEVSALLAEALGPRRGRTMAEYELTSELQSREKLVCRLLLEKKKNTNCLV